MRCSSLNYGVYWPDFVNSKRAHYVARAEGLVLGAVPQPVQGDIAQKMCIHTRALYWMETINFFFGTLTNPSYGRADSLGSSSPRLPPVALGLLS